jgi:hypothetical protein
MINKRLSEYRSLQREIDNELETRGFEAASTDQLLRSLIDIHKLIRSDEKELIKNGRKRRSR